MSEAYVIELDGAPVGLVVRVGRSFRFYASDPAYSAMEAVTYDGAAAAQRAAETLDRGKRLKSAAGVSGRASPPSGGMARSAPIWGTPFMAPAHHPQRRR
jgi:hypothetical protein